MTKNHRFAMYQNTIYDEGQIINPFECMKLLNYFYDKNTDLVKMNKQLGEENKELHEKNQLLNEKEKDMLNYLKKEYDYVYNQKRKHFDDAILVTSYELIEYHIRSMIEHLEGL